MRIRKHAKISALVYATSSLKAAAAGGGKVVQSNYECQLNQSPWDVITFESFATTPIQPNLFRVNEDDNILGNGSFVDSIEAVESLTSMKLSWDDDNNTTDLNGLKWVHPNGVAAREGGKNGPLKAVEQLAIDSKNSKNDEKQCKKNAEDKEALFELHFTQLNNTNNNGDQSIVAEPRRRPRPKRSPSSSNTDLYYYYSGFGPRWGKKRGQGRKEPNNNDADNFEHLEAFHEAFLSTQIEYQEFNHIADEDIDMNIADKYEENNEDGVKKRVRKPIKARSLKSLM